MKRSTAVFAAVLGLWPLGVPAIEAERPEEPEAPRREEGSEDEAPDLEEVETVSLTGCLSGADGEWTLTTEDGIVPVVDEGAGLETFNGHEVNVTGHWAEDEDGERRLVAHGCVRIAVCEPAG